MSDESVSREELSRKLEGTIKSLSLIVMDLTLIAGSLKLKPPAKQEPPKASVPKPAVSKPPIDKLKEVMDAFPEDLQEMLIFEETGDHIIVKTRQYLSLESFTKISSIIRDVGGQWISAGKDSRFEISKEVK